GNRLQATVHDTAAAPNYKTWPMSDDDVIADDTWHDVTMVFEEGVGTTFYVDCVAAGSVADSDVALYDYGFTAIGMGFGTPPITNNFEGEIDDLRVWNYAFSAGEIADLCEPVVDECQ
ncbi:MAG TPA: LamG-like jellyroll fold domain-containing protein, partial [Enhygromyxa sp.]|nr:LamG-like jellyroll fold domain-containing protein [Enhygromyxa sp.]